MKKRVLSLGLVTTMAISLAACGNGGGNGGGGASADVPTDRKSVV